MINLYLDDIRECPEGFMLARNIEEAKDFIKTHKIGIMSLDHDLGNKNGIVLPTGYDFVKYICERGIECEAIFIHTDNVVGRKNMYETLKGAQRRGFISSSIKIYRYGYIH